MGEDLRRLLICSPSHVVHGGVEGILADLCRAMGTSGWQVLLALGKGARFNDVARYRSAYPDLPVVEIDGTKGTRQARREALHSVVEAARPEVVLIARMFDAYAVVSALKRSGGRPRLAVTIQAYEPHYFFDARLFRDHIDLCVTSGEMIRQAAVEWCGLPQDRVVSIPGGVRPPRCAVAPRRSGTVLRLGYVGRLEENQKRVLDLVSFLDTLDRRGIAYRADVVGSGPADGSLRDKLAARVQSGTVMFHGWQDHDSLYTKVFPNLDCIVHFAGTEGVTIAPREAMIHGVVPVISEFIGLDTERQFVNGLNALTFPVGDIAAAADCIERLLKEPGLMPRLSANAMESQQGKYTHEGAMRAWSEAFERCVTQPGRTGRVPREISPPDGRLEAWGIPSWSAQRIRDALGRRHQHADPGSEWPTGSGLITREAIRELQVYAGRGSGTKAPEMVVSPGAVDRE